MAGIISTSSIILHLKHISTSKLVYRQLYQQYIPSFVHPETNFNCKCFLSLFFLCLCLGSKLLYELFKSSEQEVESNDEEECNPGKTNSVLKILVEKVCKKCHVPNVIVTSRLMQEFKSKI